MEKRRGSHRFHSTAILARVEGAACGPAFTELLYRRYAASGMRKIVPIFESSGIIWLLWKLVVQDKRVQHVDRTFRCPHCRRRHLRHQCWLLPANTLSRQALCDTGGTPRHGRDLGPVPLSRYSLRLRHVHARLFLPALERSQGHRGWTGHSEVSARFRPGVCYRPAHPFPAPGAVGGVVLGAIPLDYRGGGELPGPATGPHHVQLPVSMQRLLRLREGTHAGFSRQRGLPG